MREIVVSIEREYLRYQGLAERAIAQVPEAKLAATVADAGNSIASLVWHVSGNLRSRFTDFFSSDGEKPWRNRDSEFDLRDVTHAELGLEWSEGWAVLLGVLAELSDDDLSRRVLIRGEGLSVHEALHRSLAHTSYHIGQVVFLAKSIRGEQFECLSIPRSGKSVRGLPLNHPS